MTDYAPGIQNPRKRRSRIVIGMGTRATGGARRLLLDPLFFVILGLQARDFRIQRVCRARLLNLPSLPCSLYNLQRESELDAAASVALVLPVNGRVREKGRRRRKRGRCYRFGGMPIGRRRQKREVSERRVRSRRKPEQTQSLSPPSQPSPMLLPPSTLSPSILPIPRIHIALSCQG
ncbi:hypothetical protein GALMADRAFT_454499 [Galerina marginata CBS 339.88]|uniref:Uncharacterized protein n=1 Tax=Galerina marginata (strain CBS 339.88) TaxID=685588 RepID=A0A067T382_GALM3|nr:hypothetical protein GALMADRAFT_454499 [Galerina marginata CBS 339.88]